MAATIMTKVHIIDALPYVYRAYFSLPGGLKDPAGRQVNAVLGFANFLVRYIVSEAPTHLALCFDRSMKIDDNSRSSNFRRQLYPEYKSNRKSPPEELRSQMRRCRRISEALGVACYDDEGYEADDLIATIAKPLVETGHSCTVVTNDKDLYQLVGPQLTIFDYAKGRRYDESAVHKKLGVRPSQIPDYLGLVGDPVDCIPGVRGLGAKAATFLLARYNGLEEIYGENNAELKQVSQLGLRGSQGIADKLAAQQDRAFLSRKLATVSDTATLKGGGTLAHLLWRQPGCKLQLEERLIELGLPKHGYAYRQVSQLTQLRSS